MGGGAHLQIGLHHNILRIVVVPSQGEGIGVDGPVCGPVKGLERVGISLSDPTQQRLTVGGDQAAARLPRALHHQNHTDPSSA